jgi:hypothetical protein
MGHQGVQRTALFGGVHRQIVYRGHQQGHERQVVGQGLAPGGAGGLLEAAAQPAVRLAVGPLVRLGQGLGIDDEIAEHLPQALLFNLREL